MCGLMDSRKSALTSVGRPCTVCNYGIRKYNTPKPQEKDLRLDHSLSTPISPSSCLTHQPLQLVQALHYIPLRHDIVKLPFRPLFHPLRDLRPNGIKDVRGMFCGCRKARAEVGVGTCPEGLRERFGEEGGKLGGAGAGGEWDRCRGGRGRGAGGGGHSEWMKEERLAMLKLL